MNDSQGRNAKVGVARTRLGEPSLVPSNNDIGLMMAIELIAVARVIEAAIFLTWRIKGRE